MTIWYWFVLAVFLGVLELVLGAQFFLLACALAALLTGLLLLPFPMMLWEWQCFFFAILTVLSVPALLYCFKKQSLFSSRLIKPYLNQRAHQYIGREFTLTQDMVNNRGHIKVDDTTWRVEGENYAAQTKIVVIAVDGIVLKIKKIEDD